ncbi:MAG: flagellar biosynthetic protein FliO [Chthonomonadetes bacterium]|nr:flagellar biosynthetic protein FliO [Chthonomonadetes bacterium]
MSKAVAVIALCLMVLGQAVAEPPVAAFSPPASGVPSLHASSPPEPAQVHSPAPPSSSKPDQQGWDTLRREALPEPMGSPTSHLWRWLVGLAVALALIRWGLPRALNGGSKGQVAQWLTRLAPPKSEGTITVLDTRFLGAGAVHLVSVRGRTLLIGSTAQQVTLLMDLSEPQQNNSAFEQILAQSKPFTPEPSLHDEAGETEKVLHEFQQRLQQARQRLAG